MSAPASALAMALMVRSRRARSSSSVTSGVGVEGEAFVAGRGLALGARQRIFLVRLRVQENREVLADRLVAQRHHFLRRGADDDPVAILTGRPSNSSRTAPPTT